MYLDSFCLAAENELAEEELGSHPQLPVCTLFAQMPLREYLKV